VYVREMGIARQMDAERDGVFVSTEEREAMRKVREEASSAMREALSSVGEHAVSTDGKSVLPLRILETDADDTAGSATVGRKKKAGGKRR